MYSPEVQAQIAQWRAAALAGELSLADLTKAIALMREGRLSAAKASEGARKTKAKSIIPSGEELEKELGL